MDNLSNLENSIDGHLLPDDEETVGEDWQGEVLYGHEYGYLIDGQFILEEEVPDYIDRTYTILNAQDALG